MIYFIRYYFIFVFIAGIDLYSQDNNSSAGNFDSENPGLEYIYSLWANGGYSVGFANFSDTDIGLGINGTLTFEKDKNLFSFSYQKIYELSLFSDHQETIQSFQLKYGKAKEFRMRGLLFPFPFFLLIKKDFNYNILWRAGFAYNLYQKIPDHENEIKVNTHNTYERKSFFSIPLEIELREDITDFIGIGTGLFINLNNKYSSGGIIFNLYLGKF